MILYISLNSDYICSFESSPSIAILIMRGMAKNNETVNLRRNAQHYDFRTYAKRTVTQVNNAQISL